MIVGAEFRRNWTIRSVLAGTSVRTIQNNIELTSTLHYLAYDIDGPVDYKNTCIFSLGIQFSFPLRLHSSFSTSR